MKQNRSIEEIINDNHLFIDIRMRRYLESVNQSELISEVGAKNVLGKIIETSTNLIAPEHDRMDNSTTEAKAARFNSVNIDFFSAA